MHPRFALATVTSVGIGLALATSLSAVAQPIARADGRPPTSGLVDEAPAPALAVTEIIPSTKAEFRAPGGFRLFRVTLTAPSTSPRGIDAGGTTGLARCHFASQTASTYVANCWVLPTSPTGTFTVKANGYLNRAMAVTTSITVANLTRVRSANPAVDQISAAAARRNVTCGNTSGKVWLTFDDGYISETRARSLVAILDENRIRGRFFVVGQWARSATGKRVVALLKSRGHYVENHSSSHPKLNSLTPDGIKAEIAGGPRPNVRPFLFRPPYGSGWNVAAVNNVIARAGYQTCYWTVDTQDWAGASPALMARRIRFGDTNTPPLFRGGVILMHMNHFSTARLNAVIGAVKSRGYPIDSTADVGT